MAIPDRSELPPEFVAYLDKMNAEMEEWEPSKPVLPAESTPPELIEAARALNASITRHLDDDSLAAQLIEREWRPFIDDVLAEKITEPIDEDWRSIAGRPPIRWGDTDLYAKNRKDLETAIVRFETLIIGLDQTTPERVARVKAMVLTARKKVAQNMGVELDLTDEEWWQL